MEHCTMEHYSICSNNYYLKFIFCRLKIKTKTPIWNGKIYFLFIECQMKKKANLIACRVEDNIDLFLFRFVVANFFFFALLLIEISSCVVVAFNEAYR